MACYQPRIAAQDKVTKKVALGNKFRDLPPDSQWVGLKLPCGSCIGCRRVYAQSWALRCYLENQNHRESTIATLTYADEELQARPSWERTSLRKRDLQLCLKRLRKRLAGRVIRYFGTGEYGETTHRPHYHVLLFGLGMGDRHHLGGAWSLGHTHVLPITPQGISYVAGYAAKKYGSPDPYDQRQEVVDTRTGEVIQAWEPTFRVMSRGGRTQRGGIGAAARQWTDSWRSFAVYNGTRIPVPRYLHEAWKATATELELDTLAYEKQKRALEMDTSAPRLEAGEKIATQKEEMRAARRKL